MIAITIATLIVITSTPTLGKKYRHGLQAANDLPSLLGGVLLGKVVPLLGCKPGRSKVCHLHPHTERSATMDEAGLSASPSPASPFPTFLLVHTQTILIDMYAHTDNRDQRYMYVCQGCKANAQLCQF